MTFDPLPTTCPMCGERFEPMEFGWQDTRWELIEHPDGSMEWDAGEALDDTKDNTIGCRLCGEDFPIDIQRNVYRRLGIDDPKPPYFKYGGTRFG